MTTNIEFYNLPDAADESDPDAFIIVDGDNMSDAFAKLATALNDHGVSIDHYEYIDNDGSFARYNVIDSANNTPGVAIVDMKGM